MTATTNRHLLYQEFRKTFPLETLKDMPLEKYTNLNKDSFCYWLESKTKALGSFSGGSSYKFGIYQYQEQNKPKATDPRVQSDGKYAWYKKYQKDTAEEAYQIVLKMIVDIATYANEGNYEAIDAIDLGEAYKWKIAFLYSNECLIPFYKHEMLETLASHYGMENPRQRKTSELQRFLLSQKGDRALYEFYDDLVDILNDSKEVIWLWNGGKESFASNTLQIGSNAPTLDFESYSTATQLRNAYQKLTGIKDARVPMAYWQFLHEVKEGDMVVVIGAHKKEKGSSYHELYGWGRISSDYTIHPEAENPVWRSIEWHVPPLKEPIENHRLKDSLFFQKVDSPEQVNHIKQLLNIKQEAYPMNNECQKYIELLESTHNLILTGAPGTGKTYLAKEIAKEMGAEVGFVQFHPSYDYTDFVEGLRPTPPDNNGNIGFERKDGVFKQFCTRALQNLLDAKKSITELNEEEKIKDKLEDFVIQAIEDSTKMETSSTGNKFVIAGQTDSKILIAIPNNPTAKEVRVRKSEIIRLLLNKVNVEKVKDIKDYFHKKNGEQADSYTFVICNQLKKMKATPKVQVSQVHRKNFVFIIDEINRGEISKIFGELFFSIDPGYRGEEGAVRTQYANMQDEPNIFDDVLKTTDYGHFFIPDNVYIIGTMNDIDRSVESMDFAMRRRFAWQEITAEESMQILDNSAYGEEAKIRMQRLNEAIVKIPGLNKAYQIGAAYFLKLKGDNFDALWKNHIEGVLQEYLRGNRDADEQLKTLKEAYDNKTTAETEHEDDRQ